MKQSKVKLSFDGLLNLCGVLAAIIIVFIMTIVIYEVVMRYFLDLPSYWVLQVVEWSLVWMTFISAAFVLKEERHVSIDIVVGKLPLRTQFLLGGITSIIGALICITLCWFGFQAVWDHIIRGVVETKLIRAPKGPLMIIIPIGFLLLCIQFIRRSFKFMHKWKSY